MAKKSLRRWYVLAGVLVVMAGGLFVAYRSGSLRMFGIYRPSNAIMVIAPYRYAGTWVLDDPAVGLNREPFVSGIPEMIDEMVKDIPNAEKGFRLLFSSRPFPGYTHELVWRRGDETGNWYYCKQYDKEGWLCPGLFRYYRRAPKELYAKAEKLAGAPANQPASPPPGQ
jgi:hypothetical protein